MHVEQIKIPGLIPRIIAGGMSQPGLMRPRPWPRSSTCNSETMPPIVPIANGADAISATTSIRNVVVLGFAALGLSGFRPKRAGMTAAWEPAPKPKYTPGRAHCTDARLDGTPRQRVSGLRVSPAKPVGAVAVPTGAGRPGPYPF